MTEFLTYAALLALGSLLMLPVLLLQRRPRGYRSSTRRPTTPHPRNPPPPIGSKVRKPPPLEVVVRRDSDTSRPPEAPD